LTALGARMLADYAKNPTRRVAVAGNKRILEFTLRTMHGHIGPPGYVKVTTPQVNSTSSLSSSLLLGLNPETSAVEDSYRDRAVEYAVETIRSLTATEESDVFLMNMPDLLITLGVLARGGTTTTTPSQQQQQQEYSHDHSNAIMPIPFSASAPDTSSPLRGPRGSMLIHTASTGATPNHLAMSRRDLQVRPISRSMSNASSASNFTQDAVIASATTGDGNGALDAPFSSSLSTVGITMSPNSSFVSVGARAGAGSATSNAISTQIRISSKSRLHACIAIMNLSCGKANKIEIAKIPQVLTAMRDVMTDQKLGFGHSSTNASSSILQHVAEARLKATTCIKNLSNADANDGALLSSPGLIEALGHVILVSIRDNYTEEQEDEASRRRSTMTVTNACLALMNLSIAKANKRRVFRTAGVMEALMAVITKGSGEARVKSCSALSNLAIGYDNKIPMFHYPGFVEAILHVIETDHGEARTKACSILWSFAAETRNQVPVSESNYISFLGYVKIKVCLSYVSWYFSLHCFTSRLFPNILVIKGCSTWRYSSCSCSCCRRR